MKEEEGRGETSRLYRRLVGVKIHVLCYSPDIKRADAPGVSR